MKKVEQKFQTNFNHWLKAVWRQTGAFELKVSKGKSLPYSSVAPHQLDALMNIKHGTFVYKISDIGMVQVPMDCFCLSGVPAFVVIRFASGITYGIDVDDFVREWERSDRKSITEAEAESSSTFSF